MTFIGFSVSFWGDENVLNLDCGNGYPHNSVNILKHPELYTVSR